MRNLLLGCNKAIRVPKNRALQKQGLTNFLAAVAITTVKNADKTFVAFVGKM